MASFSMVGDENLDKLSRLETGMRREGVRRIVMAGAKVSGEEMSRDIQGAHHVKTGQMLASVGAAEYAETFGGGSVNVYPQGQDSRGVSNALKAFVINHGIGGNPTRKGQQNRTGDKFITGKIRETDAKVKAAMIAEASAFFNEMTGG